MGYGGRLRKIHKNLPSNKDLLEAYIRWEMDQGEGRGKGVQTDQKGERKRRGGEEADTP